MLAGAWAVLLARGRTCRGSLYPQATRRTVWPVIEQRVRRFYDELWNEWRFDLADDLLSDDVRFRGSLGTETEGRAGFLEYARRVRTAFPDFHNRIDDL